MARAAEVARAAALARPPKVRLDALVASLASPVSDVRGLDALARTRDNVACARAAPLAVDAVRALVFTRDEEGHGHQRGVGDFTNGVLNDDTVVLTEVGVQGTVQQLLAEMAHDAARECAAGLAEEVDLGVKPAEASSADEERLTTVDVALGCGAAVVDTAGDGVHHGFDAVCDERHLVLGPNVSVRAQNLQCVVAASAGAAGDNKYTCGVHWHVFDNATVDAADLHNCAGDAEVGAVNGNCVAAVRPAVADVAAVAARYAAGEARDGRVRFAWGLEVYVVIERAELEVGLLDGGDVEVNSQRTRWWAQDRHVEFCAWGEVRDLEARLAEDTCGR
eukprot:PhM_4_TR17375/c0_g1_i1/m.73131